MSQGIRVGMGYIADIVGIAVVPDMASDRALLLKGISYGISDMWACVISSPNKVGDIRPNTDLLPLLLPSTDNMT